MAILVKNNHIVGSMDNALLQFEEVPTDEDIQVFQYIGETSTNFTTNHIYELKDIADIYKCYVYDRDAAAGADPGTYGYHYLYIKNDYTGTFYGKIDGTNAIKVSSVDDLEVLTISLVQQGAAEYDDNHITFNNGAGTAYRNDDSNDLTGATVKEWSDLYSNSGSGLVDIVTEWEDELSNEKVPSEKLVKETIDDTIIQVEELPEITDDNKDKVYQYVGETTDAYIKGHFYQVGEKYLTIYCYGTSLSCCYRYEGETSLYCGNNGESYKQVTSEDQLGPQAFYIPVAYIADGDYCKDMQGGTSVYERYPEGDLVSTTKTGEFWIEVAMGNASISTDVNNTLVKGTDGGLYVAKVTVPTVTSTYSSTGTDAVNGKAVASAISGKANSSALGTQVTYTLSGTTLYITTK